MGKKNLNKILSKIKNNTNTLKEMTDRIEPRMKLEEDTNRGFKVITFDDRYNSNCSIQESSLASDDDNAIWFGINEAVPKRMIPGKGWVEFAIPDDILIESRMHLTQSQIKDLIPILQYFVDTGYLPENVNEKI